MWVKRAHGRGKWHLMESLINDDPVTYCGRRLRSELDPAFKTSEVMPLTRMIGQPQNCRTCDQGTVA